MSVAADVNNPLIVSAFRGALTRAGAESGIRALHENAARLARDARLLADARRYPSAAALAAMALDEIGRIPLLVALHAVDGNSRLAELWRRFREHRHDFPWAIFQTGAPQRLTSDINTALAFMRSIGNIVECLGPGNWAEPARLIQPGLAEELVATAELICLNPMSTRGITVWLETSRSLPSDCGPANALKQLRAALEAAGLNAQADALAAFCGKAPASGKSRRR